MRAPRNVLVTALWLSLGWAAWGRPAAADPLSELEKARAAYYAKNYDDAGARLRALLDPKNGAPGDAAVVADARMFLGATLLARGQKGEAESVFERLLLERPEYEPDPLGFPSSVINTFIELRASLRDKLVAEKERLVREAIERKAREAAEKERQAKRLARLEKLAAEETVVSKSSRWVALLPFGVGQFQNGQVTLGWSLLITEAVLGLAAVGHVPFYLANKLDGDVAHTEGRFFERDQYYARARDIQVSQWIVSGTAALVAVAGIVHAQLTYVPEHSSTRPRTKESQAVRVSPTFAPLATSERGASAPTGAVLGVSVRF